MAFWRALLQSASAELVGRALSRPHARRFASWRIAQAGRVPVDGAPASLNDELKRLLRDEQKPDSLFEAQRQADRAAATVARLLEVRRVLPGGGRGAAEGERHLRRAR